MNKAKDKKETAKILCKMNGISNCKCSCGYSQNYKECKKRWELLN